MTLFDYEELCGYWSDHPPVHLLVAAYLGIKSSGSNGHSSVKPPSAQDFSEVRMFPGMAEGDIHAGLPQPVFDFAELR